MSNDPYRQYLGALSKQAAFQKASKGIYTGKPVNGYLKVQWTDVHQVDETKRRKIRIVFHEGQHKSYRQLMKVADDIGLTNTSGANMGLSSLHNMLSNPFYTGLVWMGDGYLQGKHESLIEIKLLLKVNPEVFKNRHQGT